MSIFINGIDRTPVNSLVLLNAAAGNEVANRIDYSVNKVAGDSTGLLINLTPTSVPGTNYILALQTSGTDVFSVRRKGELVSTITLNLATGNETAWTLNYTTNKATSGNDTGLLINQTDTLSPGTSFLQDWQVGGVSNVCIRNDGNVGIGTNAPNANALLDITSTTKAFMPPRMTTAQRDVIAVPTAGMVIYNSTTGVLNFYNGAVWGAV